MSDATNVNFADYVQGERTRIAQRKDFLLGERKRFDDEIAALDRESAAIDAYERTKTGKAAPAAGATRARPGSRREDIINALRASDGMSRGEMLERLGVKDDKFGEISVSNALASMAKAGQVVREGGKYHLPAQELKAAAE
jgi:hypothetical protein